MVPLDFAFNPSMNFHGLFFGTVLVPRAEDSRSRVDSQAADDVDEWQVDLEAKLTDLMPSIQIQPRV